MRVLIEAILHTSFINEIILYERTLTQPFQKLSGYRTGHYHSTRYSQSDSERPVRTQPYREIPLPWARKPVCSCPWKVLMPLLCRCRHFCGRQAASPYPKLDFFGHCRHKQRTHGETAGNKRTDYRQSSHSPLLYYHKRQGHPHHFPDRRLDRRYRTKHKTLQKGSWTREPLLCRPYGVYIRLEMRKCHSPKQTCPWYWYLFYRNQCAATRYGSDSSTAAEQL